MLRGKPTHEGEWTLEGGEFKVFRGRLTVTANDVLQRSPGALVRLFGAADRVVSDWVLAGDDAIPGI